MTILRWAPRRFWALVSLALLVPALLVLAVRESAPLHALTPKAPPLGSPLPGLTAFELNLYNIGELPFAVNWPPSLGLGPVFTTAGCRGCHIGSGGGGFSTFAITLFGTHNPDGSFNPLANEGGPLLQSFSVAPLIANGSCVLAGETLPADATIVSRRQVPALFGSGLIDAIPDATIEANAAFEAGDPTDEGLGIHGVPNMSADLNGVLRPGRFGFKAQMPTLLQQVASAFQHDVGFTNPINPNEDLPQGNPIPPNCQAAATEPNDALGHITLEIFQALEFVAPVTPGPPTATTQAGQAVFNSIGCANCHMASLQTGANFTVPLTLTSSGIVASSETSSALSNQTANLYSDLLLHDMGPGLADGVVQGQASGSQWRTTPLWGLSQRTAYLHDGRVRSLNTAILDHGGEAAGVVSNYSALSATDQANLLAFLNSL